MKKILTYKEPNPTRDIKKLLQKIVQKTKIFSKNQVEEIDQLINGFGVKLEDIPQQGI